MLKVRSYEGYQSLTDELAEQLKNLCKRLDSDPLLLREKDETGVCSQAREKIDILHERLTNSSFKIIIMGEFKRGKSTFINALLGKSVLPAYSKPCTDVINEIAWGETPRVVIVKSTGTEIDVEASELEHYVTIGGKKNNNDDKTELAKLFWPLKICKHGVEIVDTPGLNEHKSRTKVTTSYLPLADAVVFVLGADQPCTMTELETIESQLCGSGNSDLFFVTNRMHSIDEKDRPDIIEHVTSKVARFTTDPKGKIHFVDSKDALEKKGRGDNISSDFFRLEESIQEHLVEKKGVLKLEKVFNEADFHINYLRTHLLDRSQALSSDLTTLQDDLDVNNKLSHQVQDLKKRVGSIWKEARDQIEIDIQRTMNSEVLAGSFDSMLRRQIDMIWQKNGAKHLQDNALMQKEIASLIQSWTSLLFINGIRPKIEMMLHRNSFIISKDVFETLREYYGDGISQVIAKDPVGALFQSMNLENLKLSNMPQLASRENTDATPKKVLSNAGLGAALLCGLDFALTGGGASLLFSALTGAGGGVLFSRFSEGKIKEECQAKCLLFFNNTLPVIETFLKKHITESLEDYEKIFVRAIENENEKILKILDQRCRDTKLSMNDKNDKIKSLEALINDLNKYLFDFKKVLK